MKSDLTGVPQWAEKGVRNLKDLNIYQLVIQLVQNSTPF